MRKYFIYTVLGILLLAMVGMQLLTAPIVGTSIEASVEIKPETLNLKKAGVVTAFIEFFDSSYNVSDIDFESIKLRVEGAPDWIDPIRCVVADGKLVVKFDGLSVAEYIIAKLVHMQIIPPQAKYPMDLVVEGMVKEDHFEGSDQIRIMLP
jgi:hypothetical protein